MWPILSIWCIKFQILQHQGSSNGPSSTKAAPQQVINIPSNQQSMATVANKAKRNILGSLRAISKEEEGRGEEGEGMPLAVLGQWLGWQKQRRQEVQPNTHHLPVVIKTLGEGEGKRGKREDMKRNEDEGGSELMGEGRTSEEENKEEVVGGTSTVANIEEGRNREAKILNQLLSVFETHKESAEKVAHLQQSIKLLEQRSSVTGAAIDSLAEVDGGGGGGDNDDDLQEPVPCENCEFDDPSKITIVGEIIPPEQVRYGAVSDSEASTSVSDPSLSSDAGSSGNLAIANHHDLVQAKAFSPSAPRRQKRQLAAIFKA